MVVDPVARLTDGESVRIARDVLCAGAPGVKVCLPEDPEETARALARRGSRRPVLVGNDRALLRAVQFLHRDRGLPEAALAVVPVGAAPTVALTRGLGVPADAVSAARAVLGGGERRLDLLVDDDGGVVLGGLHIPASPGAGRRGVPPARDAGAHGDGRSPWRRVCRSFARTVLPQGMRGGEDRPGELLTEPAEREQVAQALRVEADGRVLADLDLPVTEVSVRTAAGPGLAEVTVRAGAGAGSGAGSGAGAPDGPVVERARVVTVSGTAFRYRADARVGGPVRTRTWTVVPEGWRLVLPGA
ncbi:diacylglycerol kinase family protein [Streptomyces albiaxialis]|uniref:Diacylglycerol kinase family protein n=1 Tax=Streptomyces albiaxialis TaxID=329523 RepID=A0ABN2W5D8_9ACTN